MPYPTPDEEREREIGRPPQPDRLDEPAVGAMDPGDEPKSWDRASIQFRTHPNHPRPRLSQEDFLLPRHTDRLKALGDAVVFAACVIGLAFFPLYIAYILFPGLSHWFWLAALGAGIASGAWIYIRSVSVSPEEYLEHYEPS